MRWAVAVVLLVGCDKVFLPEERDVCFGQAGPNNTGLFHYCPEIDPVAERSLLSQVSTDDDCDAIVTDALEELCVVMARKITVGAGVRAVGDRPLVLFAASTIVVGGTLSATSQLGGARAAGANAKVCSGNAPVAPPNAITDGGGGGPGGTFEQRGGTGGVGAGASAGGMSLNGVPAGTIRGGCPGGQGGPGGQMAVAGPPGAGGGAMYLVAGESITIAGTLEASGAGGGGSGGMTGGGGPGGSGGGTGGMIALDAPSVFLTPDARLVANGGAGGGAGGSTTAAVGTSGMTANAAGAFPFPTVGGTGGGASSNGGNGGSGGDAMTAPTPGAPGLMGTGGGGGGGAVGVIRVYSTNLVDENALVSPAY